MTHTEIKAEYERQGLSLHDVIWQHTKHTYNPNLERFWKYVVMVVGIYGVYCGFLYFGG